MARIIRWVLLLCTVVLVLVGCAYFALFYWLDEALVRQKIERYAHDALNARVELNGPIQLQKLPDLTVSLPSMKFVSQDTGKALGEVRSARLTVSLWSLPLGAVQVKHAQMDGVQAALRLPLLSADALFDTTFNSVRFPKDLRVGAITLTDSNVNVTVESEGQERVFALSQLMLNMGALSPEMATPYEFSTVYSEVHPDAGVTEASVVEPAPAVPASAEAPVADVAPGEQPVADSPATEAAPVEQPTTEAPVAEVAPAAQPTADVAVPAPEAQPSADAPAPEAVPAEQPTTEAPVAEAAPATQSTTDVAVPDPAPEAQPSAETPANEAIPAEQPVVETPVGQALPADAAPITEAVPVEQPVVETPAAEAPAPEAAPAEEPIAQQPTVTLQTSFVDQFIRRAIAQALPDFDPNAPTFTTPNLFDGPTHGTFSAAGHVTISTANRFFMLEDTTFSAEVFRLGHPYSLVAKADRIRFKAQDINGMNVTATVSRPDSSQGDIHIGAVDFRFRPGSFASPELRVAYTDYDGDRTTSIDVASSVDADLGAQKVDLANFVSKIHVSDPKALTTDFVTNVSGSLNVDIAKDSAQVALSGDLGGAPFSYNGSVSSLSKPQLRGELVLNQLDLASLPAVSNLHWMHHMDFEGELRIGQLIASSFSASQVHSRMRIQDNGLTLDDMILNLADGRVMGQARVSETGDWLFNGRIDSINLDKTLALFGGKSLVSGVTNGTIALSGRGLDADAIKGHARIRVIRGTYAGIDADAVRNHIVGSGSLSAVTRADAATTMDETSADVTLSHNRLSVTKLISRSLQMRTSGEFSVDLTTNTISGKTFSVFAPQKGVASVQIAATLSGPAAGPVWTFGWEDAQKALNRSQGKPTLTLPKQDDSRSIWQSVKDFLNL